MDSRERRAPGTRFTSLLKPLGMPRAALCLWALSTAATLVGQMVPNAMAHAQGDTIAAQDLKELVVVGTAPGSHGPSDRPLGSLDNYLAKSSTVNMIRRGSYAWEPMLNGMATERSVITVDGMRIYGACTDKMDPVTSYVETANLSSARIKSGASGGEHGGTIAGSIDLERRRSGFTTQRRVGGTASAGFESNNTQRILGGALHYGSRAFYTDVDLTYRKAENYHAGPRNDAPSEVRYSQYTKYNLSSIAGYKLNEHHEVEASLIFDKATDVGYPGLPMDVSLAQAVIGSVQYRHLPHHGPLSLWETKLYRNTITHVMDDSQRPDVPIRMDMPGWSTTEGYYTKVHSATGRHRIKATLTGHRNRSRAEMTMHPANPAEPTMFMLTWPDVRTVYNGLNAEDRIQLNNKLALTVHAGVGVHANTIGSEFGRRSLELFHAALPATNVRWLPGGGATLASYRERFIHRISAGYSERAPSVSEGYGFYLLNVNDNYDYVGDPRLRNEGSYSVEFSSTYKRDKLHLECSGAWFHILHYIIGTPRRELMAMNMTAAGVKVYEQLPFATAINAGIKAGYRFSEPLELVADASWRHGQGSNGTRLPQIQPLRLRTELRYTKKQYVAEASTEASTRNCPSAEFGETRKPSYMIANLSVSRVIPLNKDRISINLGINNILNQYYTTFADWFGIPSMGRNVYCHVVYAW